MLDVRAGSGGDDSKQFVDQLFAAYTQYAFSKGLKVELMDVREGHISAKISGANAGKVFRYEAGKHCVQRIPGNQSKGKKQTSIIVVGVLPVFEDPDLEPLKDEDLEIMTCRGQGPGGQHRNNTDSAVKMVHIPTGLSAYVDGRDQKHNRVMARKVLTARVHASLREHANSTYASIRANQMADGGRTDKVRTYNFLQSRVVDHRFNLKTSNVKGIFKGEFDLIIPKDQQEGEHA